jgi:hypothetical protein
MEKIMSELLKKITDKLEEKATKFGFRGTDNVHISLILTEEEKKEFLSIKWNDHYDYEIKNNVLHINYVDELVVFCEKLEKKFNITKLEKKYGSFTYEGKTIYQTEDAFPERQIEGTIYRSYAIDKNGKVYFIIWKQYGKDAERKAFIDKSGKVIGDCLNRENACNWQDYTIEEVVF